MNTQMGLPELRQNSRVAPKGEESVSARVTALLNLASAPDRIERRREQRFPYPQLVYLTECNDSPAPSPMEGSNVLADLMSIAAEMKTALPNPTSANAAGPVIAVVGKHLSLSGFGFFHKEAIPHRRMIISFEGPPTQWTAFLIDITWCRFNGHGWYDSGGRLLKVVPSPFASAD